MHWDDGQYVAVDPTDWRTVYSEGTRARFAWWTPWATPTASAAADAAQHRQLRGGDRQGPGGARRGAGAALQLDVALHHFAARSQGGVLRHQLPAEDRGQGRDLADREPGSFEERPVEKQQRHRAASRRNRPAPKGYATIYSVSESPLVEGRDLGRHRRRQRVGDARRRRALDRGRRRHPGRAEGPVGEPRGGVGGRREHRVRVLRRPSQRQSRRLAVPHHRRRQDAGPTSRAGWRRISRCT